MSDVAITERAARAMLDFEAFSVSPAALTERFAGTTADDILRAAAGDDLIRWGRLAHETIDIAAGRRGMSPTQFRLAGQQARRAAR
jgi:hypothetical protein